MVRAGLPGHIHNRVDPDRVSATGLGESGAQSGGDEQPDKCNHRHFRALSINDFSNTFARMKE
jgi:hypothetical protein